MSLPTLEYNGVDMSAAGLDLLLENVELPPAPAARLDIVDIPADAGGVGQAVAYESRTLSLDVSVQKTTVAAAKASVRAWAAIFNVREPSKIVMTAMGMNDRYWMGRLLDSDVVEQTALGYIKQRLRFYCPDPVAFNETETTETIADLSVTTSINVDYDGDWWAMPVYEFTAAGSVSTFTLTNSTTGETITWSGSLTAGQKLEIDSTLRRVRKYSGGAWSVVNSGVNATATFPRLKPVAVYGTARTNAISVSGAAAGSFTVTYRDRWLTG